MTYLENKMKENLFPTDWEIVTDNNNRLKCWCKNY